MAALSTIALATAAAAAAAGTGLAVHQAVEGPPDMDTPDVPPPPAITPDLEMPDPLDPVKRKQKQASILKSVKGGSADTILSGGSGFKLGG